MSLALFLACCAFAAIVCACVTYIVSTIVGAFRQPVEQNREVVQAVADLTKIAETMRTHRHPLPQRTPWMAMAQQDHADNDATLRDLEDYFDVRRGQIFAVPPMAAGPRIPIPPAQVDEFEQVMVRNFPEDEEWCIEVELRNAFRDLDERRGGEQR